MITDVTIISTNLNKDVLKNYNDYKLIINSFSYEELIQYEKVIFFNVLNELTSEEVKKLFDYLKLHRIKFINATNNMEEILYTKDLIIYDKENIVAEGNTLELIKNDKLFRRLGFKLPFIVSLSILLKDYGLVNKIYLDKESLVGDLWK